ncbi:hypothetical protein M1506_01875 [Patescibacteria group bacterium]|nr:hypothetical protein [Patescibacteria group bacterium]
MKLPLWETIIIAVIAIFIVYKVARSLAITSKCKKVLKSKLEKMKAEGLIENGENDSDSETGDAEGN